ncbi:MAG TPA: NIL domain-containing protein [Dehalococcoidales bacterium]|nr:NIL domain-containing protein [Dehalococcoidales bacterium]
MVKRRLIFTFPTELIKEPIIYNLGQHFNVITNIHLADVSEEKGWIVLDLEGEESDIEQGIAWATSRGVRIDPFVGDISGGLE